MKLLAGVGLLLVVPVVLAALDMGDENKLSYCTMLINRRVYREEKLEDFCLLKVQQWDDQVWLFIFKIKQHEFTCGCLTR